MSRVLKLLVVVWGATVTKCWFSGKIYTIKHDHNTGIAIDNSMSTFVIKTNFISTFILEKTLFSRASTDKINKSYFVIIICPQ